MSMILFVVVTILALALYFAVREVLWLKDVAESQLSEIDWYKNAIDKAQNVDRLRSDMERHHRREKAKIGL